jgi:hypothetical protein
MVRALPFQEGVIEKDAFQSREGREEKAVTRNLQALLVCLVLAVVLLATAMPAGAQLQPSSEVLLPYFEVNLQKVSASNTLLEVGNVLDKPVDIEITVSTNWGIVVAKTNLKLAAHQVRSFNLRGWIAGELPGKRLTAAETNHFKAALTGLRSPKDNLYYASQIGPGLAVGSVRIKTLGAPQPDALWGTYFLLDGDQGSGEGDTLINLDPGTGCIGGCKRHALRFLTAGTFDGGTQVVVWSETAGKPSSTSQAAGYVQADTLAYDDAGKPLGGNRLRLLPLQVVSIADLGVRQPSGSIDLQTETTSVVAVHYSSKNRFGVSLMSYCLPFTVDPGDPGIRIEKRTNGEDADTAPGPSIQVGQPVLWEYIVENTGSGLLTDIQVSDDKGVDVSCPQTELGPGEQMTCTGRGIAEACQYENLGTATARTSADETIAAEDLSHYFGDQNAAIDIELLVNGEDADTPQGPTVDVGSKINWTYLVTNKGDVALSSIEVSDAQGASVGCPKASLRPGESMTCTAGGTAAKGQIKNVGSVSGQSSCSEVSDEDPGYYFGGDTPEPPSGISLKKLTNSDDSQAAPGKSIAAGSAVRWDFIVTNTGKARLDNVRVTDDKEGAVSCPKSSLQAGESMTCAKTGVARACQYSNTGTVTAASSGGTVASSSDQSWYFGQTSPALQIETSTNGQDADAATGPEVPVGNPVQWTYTVTNSGNVALRDVRVADDHGVTVSCPKASLQAGESMTCSASGVAVEGQYRNVGTATGTADTLCGGNAGASDPSHYLGRPQPSGISLKKLTNSDDSQAAPGRSIAVGSAVRWDFIVTNTGKTRLDNVRVTDDKEGAVSCPKSSLQAGESMTCAKAGVVKACQYSNTGTVTAASSGGAAVSSSDQSWYFGQTSPALQIKTLTNGQDADAATGPEIPVGNPVQWTYTVTNSGNVALRDVRVADDHGVTVSCPKASLQAGESMTCSAGGVAVAGQYRNVGTATGTADTLCGGNASASDPSHYQGTSVNHPPLCNGRPSISSLWPPNHKMVSIEVLGISDPDRDPVTVKIDGITQDELVNDQGDGNTETDGAGVGTSTAQVRSERSGLGDGRVYVIRFTARDNRGGSCSGAVSVGVPHDQRGTPPVDSGQLYDSTVP